MGPRNPSGRASLCGDSLKVSFENARTCCCGRTGCGCCAKSLQGWQTAAGKSRLQFVQEVVQGRDAFLQAFALAGLRHHLAGATGVVEGVSGQDLPVVKHALGEGLTTCVGPQVSSEACRKGMERVQEAAGRRRSLGTQALPRVDHHVGP